jgi:NAD(P)-dependent dehydrogenase (short-subunit alcohol dehydrogenase family)
MTLADNRVALVTGGSRGLGRSTALALARGGADVIVTYRTQKRSALEVGLYTRSKPRSGEDHEDISQHWLRTRNGLCHSRTVR